ADTAGKKNGLGAVAKPSRRAQRGVPLVQWVWPANSGIARVGSEWFRGAAAAAASSKQVSQENPVRVQGKMQGRTRKSSSVVVGTVCEPVRPTRLDLSSSQEYTPTADRPCFIVFVCAYPSLRENKWSACFNSEKRAYAAAASAGKKSCRGTYSCRRPASLSNGRLAVSAYAIDINTSAYFRSAVTALHTNIFLSPRYLQSTTVSQAKAVEPSGKSRALESRPSRRVGSARRGGNGGPDGGVSSEIGSSTNHAGTAGTGDSGLKRTAWDCELFVHTGQVFIFRAPAFAASRVGGDSSGVFRRLRKSTETKHSRYGSVKIKAPSSSMGGGGRAPAADNSIRTLPESVASGTNVLSSQSVGEIITMHTPGVLRPEGVRLRVVKASGRTLEDTKFHMEIRTQRPGQVSFSSFQSLHSCLQGRFPALVLPRLPRPPPTGGGIVLEPATLERARAGLQGYIAAVVSKVPAAWGLEEFVMFLDSDEKGRRLFSRRKRKKE
ncbi:unnamed protein product, partial [Scytosiphon promiscuus]